MGATWLRGSFLARAAFEEGHEAVGVGVGKRLEEDGVDDREDGAVGADAQHQGEDDGEEEGGAFEEAAVGSSEGACDS